MADYSNTSPYFETQEIADYLDILNPRTLTAEQDDQTYTIERTYAYRPDLLAYDLYGTPRLKRHPRWQDGCLGYSTTPS